MFCLESLWGPIFSPTAPQIGLVSLGPIVTDHLTSPFCTISGPASFLSVFKLFVPGSHPLLSILSHSGKGGGIRFIFSLPRWLQQLASLSCAAPSPPGAPGPCPLPPVQSRLCSQGPTPAASPLQKMCATPPIRGSANLATCFHASLMALRSPMSGQT